MNKFEPYILYNQYEIEKPKKVYHLFDYYKEKTEREYIANLSRNLSKGCYVW